VYTPPCSPKGNELVRSPEWTFNLGMMYRRPVDFGFIGGSFDYKWTDDFFWEIDNRLVEPSYGLLNGQLFWQTADERWGVSVWGRNITDEEYSMFAVAQASCGAVCPTPANPAGNPFWHRRPVRGGGAPHLGCGAQLQVLRFRAIDRLIVPGAPIRLDEGVSVRRRPAGFGIRF
jgi:hypothetical protein